MAKTTKAQKSGRREEAVSERILKAAKRIGREPAAEATEHAPTETAQEAANDALRDNFLEALHGIASGGLYIDEEQSNLRYERALMRVAAAQLRAIKLAVLDGEEANCTPGCWAPGDGGFDNIEAGMALAGVIALLNHGPELIYHLRKAGGAE